MHACMYKQCQLQDIYCSYQLQCLFCRIVALCCYSFFACCAIFQVDRAALMVEKLCTPMDEEHNEHKKLQLRELAALNGTLKDEVACFHCGSEDHTSDMCPKKELEVYRLPDAVQSQVQEQYERDVARVRGEGGVGMMEAEYKSFLAELGGAPPPELMGLDLLGKFFHNDFTGEGSVTMHVQSFPDCDMFVLASSCLAPHTSWSCAVWLTLVVKFYLLL